MKKHSKMEKTNQKEKPLEKNSESSQIIQDIMNDYDNLEKKLQSDKIDIFKWQTLENTVLCKAFNNYTPGKKKLLSFDLDDTLISFAKSGKSKSPNKTKESPSYNFTFDINKVKAKLDEYQKNDYIFIYIKENADIVVDFVVVVVHIVVQDIAELDTVEVGNFEQDFLLDNVEQDIVQQDNAELVFVD